MKGDLFAPPLRDAVVPLHDFGPQRVVERIVAYGVGAHEPFLDVAPRSRFGCGLLVLQDGRIAHPVAGVYLSAVMLRLLPCEADSVAGR